MNKSQNTTKDLMDFIGRAPTAYQAVEEIAHMLEKTGFHHLSLSEKDRRDIRVGEKYYFTCNQSSLIAVKIPENFRTAFSVMSSHSDSPTFKIKQDGEREASDYIVLETERYSSGGILSTWLDRPLSLAGRAVIAETKDGETALKSKSICFDRDLLLIPNVAIHLQRKLNDGYAYQLTNDFLPIFSEKSGGKISLSRLIAEQLAVKEEQVFSYDLYLYNRMAGKLFGAKEDFFAAPRIDNLQCAYATLRAFIDAQPSQNIAVYATFDSEEMGSGTRMGAASPFFENVLSTVAKALGFDVREAIEASMMISADNAHAIHPGHPELSDSPRAPRLNGGIVLKHQASGRYTTDAMSAALVNELCRRAHVPLQHYENRSDMPGASTIGCVVATRLGIASADIGLPQLAMHSTYETAGCKDTDYLIDFSRHFYEANASFTEDSIVFL